MSGARKLAAAGLAVLGVRLLVLCGAGAVISKKVDELSDSGRVVSAVVSLELGPRDSARPQAGSPAPLVSATAEPTPSAPSAEPPESGEIQVTTITGALAFSNKTQLEIDAAALIREGPSAVLPKDGPQILIIHTHSSEAYTPDGFDRYEASDLSRTEDTRYNVVRVGDELTAALESYGLSVLHDREIYDYPSYTGSYSRSGEAVEAHLAENPGIAVVIDLHRDALASDGVVYKTMAELSGETSSQVMLLCGTGENGLNHPNWRENLKLALYLQQAMNKKFPTLARPVAVVPERYNQHLSTGSLILEVGSSGNTLREALCAARLFADAAGPALLQLVEE